MQQEKQRKTGHRENTEQNFFLYILKNQIQKQKTCSIEIVVQGNFGEERDGGKQDARKCIWSSSCSVTF